MEIPFVGGAYTLRSPDLDSQTCVNFYVEVDKQGGKNPAALMGRPGLVQWANPGSTTGEIRGLHVVGDYLYAVRAGTLYKITSGGTVTPVTGTLSGTGIPVGMADNGLQLMIVESNLDGWIYTISTDTLAKITDADFPSNPRSVTQMDGYFIVSEDDSSKFYISASYDGTSWSATDYATAEASSDRIIRVFAHNQELWIFGERTTEVWYDSGNATFPFERVSGVYIDVGMDAGGRNTVVKYKRSLIWISDKKQVVMTMGYDPVVISTPAIDYALQNYTGASNAVAFLIEFEGHAFYVLKWDLNTWVYDLVTGFWSRWTSFGTSHSYFRGNCYAYFGNPKTHLVGDYENGKIYEFDPDTYQDDGNAITRERASQVIHKDRRRLFFHRFEIDVESGVGTGTLDHDWSDDGGHSFSTPVSKSFGGTGAYTTRLVWNRLGNARQRVLRVTCDDNIKVAILGAYLEAEIGGY